MTTVEPTRVLAGKLAAGAALSAGILLGAALPCRSEGIEILLDPRHASLRVGAYSDLERFQREVFDGLARCQGKLAAKARRVGIIGPQLAAAISSLVACPSFAALAPDSPARRGVISKDLWQLVLADAPAPTAEQRAAAMTLTFEATDFADKPEWNFCQDTTESTSLRVEAARLGHCRNLTDPCSLLTWGPRGATAGQGREIQWILWMLARRAPGELSSAFGPEAANVRRFIRLRGPLPLTCNGTSPLEQFMCSVWLDDTRRGQWEQALRRLGESPAVRAIYAQLYAALEFDGEKIVRYHSIWRELGLTVSEVDSAFFFDRATHVGGPPDPDTAFLGRLRDCLQHAPAAATRNGAARRCLSLLHPHPTQPRDRAGRDAAYYLEHFAARAVPQQELDVWDRHIPVLAGRDFGLSDARPAALQRPEPRALDRRDAPPQDIVTLEPMDRTCPSQLIWASRNDKRSRH